MEGFVPTAAAPAVPGAPPPTPVPGATYTDIPLSNVSKGICHLKIVNDKI